MERWTGKLAVVTGGSSGIGAACVKDLINAGVIVAILARREHVMNNFKNSFPDNLKQNIYPVKCDVTVDNEVISAFKWIKENLGSVHILINSAGIADSIYLSGTYCTKQLQKNVDTNVMGTVFCVREAFNQMKDDKIDGHIILLNSVFDEYTPSCAFGSMNIYSATKCAITAMTETYRQEFSAAGTNIKVTSISPGSVNSGSLPASIRDLVDFTMLKSENVSNTIIFCLSTPPHVQIQNIKIKPMHEQF
ncbi:DHRS11.2 family protein [Megaselia abdita]